MFDELSRDRRFLDVAKQIVGDDVYLHQSRINIKPALDGKSFPWHSDFETWHVEDGLPAPRVVTGWIMLTENTPYNGPLFVIPGSHKEYVSCPGTTPKDNYKTSLRNQMLGTPSLKALKEFATKAEEEVIGVYGKAGTVVFHECNIMHGSPDNISPWPRTNCFFVYNSVNNKPINPPFGAKELRPEFLCNKNNSPLTTSN
ncbi:MAG: phytanoyl-CoA dioxygenase family protein [Campylobacterales bacterium]